MHTCRGAFQHEMRRRRCCALAGDGAACCISPAVEQRLEPRPCRIDRGGGQRAPARLHFPSCPVQHRELPPVVQVSRGSSGRSVAWVARRCPWTIERDVACWFAMRRTQTYGSPVVQRAQVPREPVALRDGARGENEVVLLKSPAYVIDGNEHQWQKRFELSEGMKDASYRTWLNSLECRNDRNGGGALMSGQGPW